MMQNPILRGFNPDPSIIRVGEDYYIATSTFEWFPGVQIHHSRDLVHWELLTRPLDRVSQLNLKGVQNSAGIFAPCLTYDQGVFYLVYTIVNTGERTFMDTLNFLVTARDIRGPWSEPVFLNASGFDPSLFHDEDGRKWLVNMLWDYRNSHHMAGIVLQEYNPKEQRLIGPVHHIFRGADGYDGSEGPHLYKRNGWYYLIVAEGGTGYGHFVTMARSRTLTGPYEVHPDNPVLTSRNESDHVLQKSGHADLVETQNGEWYMVYLCGRPLPGKRRCTLGRETCIQKVVWDEDNWLRLAHGGNAPLVQVPAPDIPEIPAPVRPVRDDFNLPVLDIHFQTLRVPLGEDALSLTERPGYLRLKGKESLLSLHQQSLVARRQQAFHYTTTTVVEFEPETFLQLAGLVCLYNTDNFYYLAVSRNETMGKCLFIIANEAGRIRYPVKLGVPLGTFGPVYLRVTVDNDRLQFFFGPDEKDWRKIGPVFDASILSDEFGMEHGTGWFTGAFVGLCCQDLSGRSLPADFDFFEYLERDNESD